MAMHRISTMTLGFVLIFVGAQLNVVESYTMTPRMANFISADGTVADVIPATAANNSPYYQASWQNPAAAQGSAIIPTRSRELTLPRWLCWPVLFLGAVVLLQGISMTRSS